MPLLNSTIQALIFELMQDKFSLMDDFRYPLKLPLDFRSAYPIKNNIINVYMHIFMSILW